MNERHIGLDSEEFKAEIKVFSTWPDGTESHTWTQLIVELIDNAHTDSWEKNPKEIQPDDFYEMVLTILARHMAYTLPIDVSDSAYNVLMQYIEALHTNGHLKDFVTNHSEDEDE